jgi:hypothetical protein
MVNINNINTSDIIIDYSIPNILNIKSNIECEYIVKKMVYVAPLLYDLSLGTNVNRTINILTTFINTNEPRRKRLLQSLDELQVQNKNINNCFNSDDLRSLYFNTKILINIHQTEHHHTFEELRVLPALLSGIIVISEESPLSDHIPYREFIIWADYSSIHTIAYDVLTRYEEYHRRTFSKENIEKLSAIVNHLKYETYAKLNSLISS